MLMNAEFRNLVFINYSVDRNLLESRLPTGVRLHLLNGKAYVSIVAFLFENLELQGIPAPFHQQFEEVNLRFYVRGDDSQKETHGVVFIREIVPKSLVTAAARALFNEKYLTLPMDHTFQTGTDGINTIEYTWQTSQKSFVHVAFKNEWKIPEPDSAEHFFCARPVAFTRTGEGKTKEMRMEHPVWRVTPVLNTLTEYDIPSVFGQELVPFLTLKPFSAFVAEGSPIRMRS